MLTSISSVVKRASPLKFKRDIEFPTIVKSIIYMTNFLGNERFDKELIQTPKKANLIESDSNISSDACKADSLDLYDLNLE